MRLRKPIRAIIDQQCRITRRGKRRDSTDYAGLRHCGDASHCWT